MIKITKNCPMCGRETKIMVDAEKYNDYRTGKGLIQNVFPELSPAEREVLKTGICQKCWNEMFDLKED